MSLKDLENENYILLVFTWRWSTKFWNVAFQIGHGVESKELQYWRMSGTKIIDLQIKWGDFSNPGGRVNVHEQVKIKVGKILRPKQLGEVQPFCGVNE